MSEGKKRGDWEGDAKIIGRTFSTGRLKRKKKIRRLRSVWRRMKEGTRDEDVEKL